MANALTVYFSRRGENYFPGGIRSVTQGNTEIAAAFVREAVGGDLFEIDTVTPYAENYRACCAQAKEEMQTGARPEIKGFVEDISQYDTIFVCYPNWCGTVPMCVLTFLEHYDLTGKKIAPLCTNEGSGMGNSEATLRKSCPGASFAEGLSVRGHMVRQSEAEIAAWARTRL